MMSYSTLDRKIFTRVISKNHRVSFVTNCPLTTVIADNNYYRGFDIDAQKATKFTLKRISNILLLLLMV